MSMIERVARAILKARFYDYEPEMYAGLDGFFAEVDEEHVEGAREEARAAIEAMRVPTDAMEWVGDDAHDPHVRNASEIWNAMIDAALSEQQP